MCICKQEDLDTIVKTLNRTILPSVVSQKFKGFPSISCSGISKTNWLNLAICYLVKQLLVPYCALIDGAISGSDCPILVLFTRVGLTNCQIKLVPHSCHNLRRSIDTVTYTL